MEATNNTDKGAGTPTNTNKGADTSTKNEKPKEQPKEMSQQEMERLAKAYYAGYVVYFIALVALIVYGMRSGRGGWYYAGAVLLVAPALGGIVGGGFALFGKRKD